MIRGLALCIGVLAAIPAAAQNSGLERLTRPDQIASWKAVGRVDVGTSGYCTGTLIAADLVLTAAHCLFDGDGNPHPVNGIVFRAGFADGTSIAEVPVARATAHDEYRPSRTGVQGAAQIRHDVALLHLASPIPTSLAPPFAVDSPGAGDQVSVVSYARGRDSALSWQRSCTVLGRESGLIAVDCDVSFGSSGAPVFDRSQGRARVVSIISGGSGGDSAGRSGTGRDGAGVALGMELPALVSDLKAQLRAGRGVLGGRVQPGAGIRRIGVGSDSMTSGARFVKVPQTE